MSSPDAMEEDTQSLTTGIKRKIDEITSNTSDELKESLDKVRQMDCVQRARYFASLFTTKNNVIKITNTYQQTLAEELMRIYDIDHYLTLAGKYTSSEILACKCGARLLKNQPHHREHCPNLCQSCFYENISNEPSLITLHSMIQELKYSPIEESTFTRKDLINYDVSPSFYEGITLLMELFTKPLRKSDLYRKNPIFSSQIPYLEYLEFILLAIQVLKNPTKTSLKHVQKYTELFTLPLYFRANISVGGQPTKISNHKCEIRWLFEWKVKITPETKEDVFENPIEKKLKNFGKCLEHNDILRGLTIIHSFHKKLPMLYHPDQIDNFLLTDNRIRTFSRCEQSQVEFLDSELMDDPYFCSNLIHLYCANADMQTTLRTIIVSPMYRWIEHQEKTKVDTLCTRIAVAVMVE